MQPCSTVFASLLVLTALAPPVAAQRMVILVRHAEKAADTGDPPLTDIGKKRAEVLADRLKDAGITSIYVTDTLRTKQTAEPLATALQITPVVRSANEAADALVVHLATAQADDIVLAVGHSNTLPTILDALLKRASGVKIADDEYDHLFVLVRKKDGSWGLVRTRY